MKICINMKSHEKNKVFVVKNEIYLSNKYKDIDSII